MTLLTDQKSTVGEESVKVQTESEKNQGLFLVVALLVATAVWVLLFVARVQAHQINVDDYLYADVARSLFGHGHFVSSFLHTGTTSPLVPTLAAPGADIGGVYGAMTVELPFYPDVGGRQLLRGPCVAVTPGGDGGCAGGRPQ